MFPPRLKSPSHPSLSYSCQPSMHPSHLVSYLLASLNLTIARKCTGTLCKTVFRLDTQGGTAAPLCTAGETSAVAYTAMCVFAFPVRHVGYRSCALIATGASLDRLHPRLQYSCAVRRSLIVCTISHRGAKETFRSFPFREQARLRDDKMRCKRVIEREKSTSESAKIELSYEEASVF